MTTGLNYLGQLGLGTTNDVRVFSKVMQDQEIIKIARGAWHSNLITT